MRLSNITESDISGLLSAARNYNKVFLITAELAEGGVKKFRVKAQSERVAREKFSQHASMAKILKVEDITNEGYTVTRGIDRERYQERQGLEGPFHTKSGKVVYYDKVEGKYYDPDTDMYIEYDDWRAMNEAGEDTFMSALKGLKTWQVVIMNNYYRGKYSDYSGRYYYVLATSPEEAKQVVLDNADAILQDLLSMKSHNGKKILPRGSAVRITPERIGAIKDGTEAGRMSTAGYKKMFSPQGVMIVKLSGGAVVDVQGQEVNEMDSQGYTGSREGSDPDAGKKEYSGKIMTAKDAVSHMHKALDRALSKEKKASPTQVEKNKARWAQRQAEKGVAEGHADQQRKVFKKNGKPVGEVGIDRESSPGNGQWYMKCYANGIDNTGYDSYEEAVAELKHCLAQGVAEGSDNIRSMIQQYEDMVELVYDLPPGRKKNIAIDKRDALEAQIEAMPGGSEALRKWARAYNDSFDEGVAEGLPQTLRKVVPGYAKREIDKKMDAGKFGKTDADKDANYWRYKKIQDKLKEQGVAEGTESSIEKKIQAKQDSLSLAREQRRARGQRQQGPREIKLQAEIDKLNTELTQLKKKGVAEAGKNPHPKTWHDVDKKLGKAVDKMSQAEKVKKGLAHPDTLKKQGVAEGVEIVDQDSDLDQQVFTLNVDGKTVSFTYWDYENNFQNPDIKDIYQQAREQLGKKLSPEQIKAVARAVFKSFKQGVAEATGNTGLPHDFTAVQPGAEVWYKGRFAGWTTGKVYDDPYGKAGKMVAFEPNPSEFPGDDGRILSLPYDEVSLRKSTSIGKLKGPGQGVAEGRLHNPGQEDSPVAQAIIRRVLLQRTDLLAKYGPGFVGQAIDDVADSVGAVDEIGSSDVSGWIRHVEQMLGNMGGSQFESEGGPKSALGKALWRDLSKFKKASPAQQQRNKERWATNPHNPINKAK